MMGWFSDVHAAVRSGLELGAFLVAGALVFRPFKRDVVLARAPFFLEALGFLLILGIGDLGFAFSVLSKPLTSELATRRYLIALAVTIAAGMLWAIVNLRLRRAVTFNLVALVVSAGWALLFLLALTGIFVWYL